MTRILLALFACIALTPAIADDLSGCDAGDAEACYRLALNIVGDDIDGGYAAMHAGCDGDFPKACDKLGWWYDQGRRPDFEKSTMFFVKACNQGHAHSCRSAARGYYNGKGVAVNVQRAASYMKMACDKGNSESCGGEVIDAKGKMAMLEPSVLEKSIYNERTLTEYLSQRNIGIGKEILKNCRDHDLVCTVSGHRGYVIKRDLGPRMNHIAPTYPRAFSRNAIILPDYFNEALYDSIVIRIGVLDVLNRMIAEGSTDEVKFKKFLYNCMIPMIELNYGKRDIYKVSHHCEQLNTANLAVIRNRHNSTIFEMYDNVMEFVLVHEMGHHVLQSVGEETREAERDADVFAFQYLDTVYDLDAGYYFALFDIFRKIYDAGAMRAELVSMTSVFGLAEDMPEALSVFLKTARTGTTEAQASEIYLSSPCRLAEALDGLEITVADGTLKAMGTEFSGAVESGLPEELATFLPTMELFAPALAESMSAIFPPCK